MNFAPLTTSAQQVATGFVSAGSWVASQAVGAGQTAITFVTAQAVKTGAPGWIAATRPVQFAAPYAAKVATVASKVSAFATPYIGKAASFAVSGYGVALTFAGAAALSAYKAWNEPSKGWKVVHSANFIVLTALAVGAFQLKTASVIL